MTLRIAGLSKKTGGKEKRVRPGPYTLIMTALSIIRFVLNRLLGWLGRSSCRDGPYSGLLGLSTVHVSVALGHWSQNNDWYVAQTEKSWPVTTGNIRIAASCVQQIDSV